MSATARPAAETPDVAGLAHVGTVSFLAGRITPVGAFWVSLAGGVALARIGSRVGARGGYGASLAVMTETVAVMGPARISGPVTQALSAPLLGAMAARGRGTAALLAACFAIRLAHYAVLTAFFIAVIVGGIDAYVDSYDRVVELTGGLLPSGATAALVLGLLSNLAGAVVFSAVQVAVYRRALADAAPVDGAAERIPSVVAAPARSARRLVALVWVVVAAWCVMLATPAWPVLAVVTAGVAAGTAAARGEGRRSMRLGAGLGVALALGALGPGVLGAVPFDDAARRAVRALLLVASAAVVQGIAGPDGVRRLAAGALHALRRAPGAREAAALAPGLRADRRVIPASLELVARVREAAPSPRALTAAVLTWVDDEARRGPGAR
ncbi:hypothetical protein [Paraconexibacter algicola]|uniref:hypothetical protein n=1 Tax=Paraconexibacter algicola TaxID=2133960 RepID=UPI0011B1D1A6|nr:hypothetical protein [Paraconexibacter algicola]